MYITYAFAVIAIRRYALLEAAEEVAEPPRFPLKEFKCPTCGGVASVVCMNSVLIAECHACGLQAKERR